MDNNTIYWHLPGLCYFGMINHILFDAMKRFPEKFNEGYKIGSVYGTIPGAIWNGGRTINDSQASEQQIEQIIKSYNAFGIPARFTWTNVLLEEQHLADPFCNKIMKIGDNGFNQVLVSNDILENYIRSEYPSYKVLSSTTKRILSVDRLIEELNKDYFLVVLDYDLNHNESVIEKMTPYANKIEILTNEVCQPNCPNRSAHYRFISKCQLEGDTKKLYPCTDKSHDARTFKGCMNRPQFMSIKDIEEYAAKGFRNYKIVGRGLSQEFYIDSLIYFLVKPEERELMRRHINGMLAKLRSGRRR